MLAFIKKVPLFHKIMIGFALGIIVGAIMGPSASMFEFLGTIMINLLQVVVAPLIMCLMISTIGSVTDMRSFGGIAIKTILNYTVMMLIAIALGLGMALLLNVGEGANIDVSTLTAAEATEVSFVDTIVNMAPSNIFNALATDELIQVIVFSLIFAYCCTKIGEPGQKIIDLFTTFADVMKQFVNVVLQVTPSASSA